MINLNMNNINQRILSQLPQEQQIVYTAMMMDPKMIPDLNGHLIQDANELGKKIKKLFDDKIFTKMYLTHEGKVVVH